MSGVTAVAAPPVWMLVDCPGKVGLVFQGECVFKRQQRVLARKRADELDRGRCATFHLGQALALSRRLPSLHEMPSRALPCRCFALFSRLPDRSQSRTAHALRYLGPATIPQSWEGRGSRS